jgi:hypothetical protein
MDEHDNFQWTDAIEIDAWREALGNALRAS